MPVIGGFFLALSLEGCLRDLNSLVIEGFNFACHCGDIYSPVIGGFKLACPWRIEIRLSLED